MKPFILAALLAVASGAQAQSLALPEPLKQAPHAQHNGGMDPAETPMLAAETVDGNFRQWYAGQKRPALVLYFNRQLDQMPEGWHGNSRLLIEDVSRSGKQEDSRTIAIGVQHNSQKQSRSRSQLARLFEQSLGAELKKQEVRLLDSTILHRKLAAGNRGASTDIEYDSLSRSARFVLEVELVWVNGACEAVASVKDIRNGEIPASVRLTVESLNSSSEIDQVSRALVQRLMQYKVA